MATSHWRNPLSLKILDHPQYISYSHVLFFLSNYRRTKLNLAPILLDCCSGQLLYFGTSLRFSSAAATAGVFHPWWPPYSGVTQKADLAQRRYFTLAVGLPGCYHTPSLYPCWTCPVFSSFGRCHQRMSAQHSPTADVGPIRIGQSVISSFNYVTESTPFNISSASTSHIHFMVTDTWRFPGGAVFLEQS